MAGLPKDRRGELLLNGEVLIEQDFAQPAPLSPLRDEGIKLDFDPYDVWAFPRAEAKLALNIGFNCKRGLEGSPAPYGPRGLGAGLPLHDQARARGRGPQRTHPRVPRVGRGVMLMGIDSRMCLDVLKGCRKAGNAALPVHDSFQFRRRRGLRSGHHGRGAGPCECHDFSKGFSRFGSTVPT